MKTLAAKKLKSKGMKRGQKPEKKRDKKPAGSMNVFSDFLLLGVVLGQAQVVFFNVWRLLTGAKRSSRLLFRDRAFIWFLVRTIKYPPLGDLPRKKI